MRLPSVLPSKVTQGYWQCHSWNTYDFLFVFDVPVLYHFQASYWSNIAYVSYPTCNWCPNKGVHYRLTRMPKIPLSCFLNDWFRHTVLIQYSTRVGQMDGHVWSIHRPTILCIYIAYATHSKEYSICCTVCIRTFHQGIGYFTNHIHKMWLDVAVTYKYK